ncbi:MAG: hypothetical protein IT281_10445 [Ignavibacteria bacterium]|nr:hypothetical protein [Ignavibacteria bacterium]
MKEKNRLPTPTEEQPPLEIDEQMNDTNSIQTHEIEQSLMIENRAREKMKIKFI